MSNNQMFLMPNFLPEDFTLPRLHRGSSSVGSLPRPSVRGGAKRPRLLLSVSLADVDRMKKDVTRFHKI